MITEVNHYPYVWSPGFGKIVWQATTDNLNEIDFKYVVDVYINGVFQERFKQRPNPGGYLIFDVGAICASYLDPSIGILEDALYNYQWRTGEDISGLVSIRVGEEYRTAIGAALIIYDGLTGDNAGSPAFYMGARADGTLITGTGAGFPGTTGATGGTGTEVRFGTDYKTANEVWLTELTNSWEYQYSMNLSGSRQGKFLTLAPNRSNTVQRGLQTDHHSLTFRNDTDTADGWNRYVYGAKAILYSSTGSIVTSQSFYNTVSNGGGPMVGNTGGWTGAGYTGTTPEKYELGQLFCGPYDISAWGTGINASTWNSTDYYTVQLFRKGITGAGSTGTGIAMGTAISEAIRFNCVDEDCSGFTKWRFSWLNKLGGRDWFTFWKRDTEKYTSDKQSYYRSEPYWSDGIYGPDTTSTTSFGTTVSNNTIETEYSAMTDWVTEDESTFLQGLFTSSHVLAYKDNSGYPQPVTITNKEYEVKNYPRQRMFNYTIEFTAGQPINAQYL